MSKEADVLTSAEFHTEEREKHSLYGRHGKAA